MQRSGSQKVLLVLSIISIIGAVLVLLSGLAIMLGGALIGSVDATEAADALAGTGITQSQAGVFAGVSGLVIVFAGVIELIVGILGVRAANDNQKIMPVWVLALIELILYAISLIMICVNGTFGTEGVGAIVSVIVAALILWICNNIKREAGK